MLSSNTDDDLSVYEEILKLEKLQMTVILIFMSGFILTAIAAFITIAISIRRKNTSPLLYTMEVLYLFAGTFGMAYNIMIYRKIDISETKVLMMNIISVLSQKWARWLFSLQYWKVAYTLDCYLQGKEESFVANETIYRSLQILGGVYNIIFVSLLQYDIAHNIPAYLPFSLALVQTVCISLIIGDSIRRIGHLVTLFPNLRLNQTFFILHAISLTCVILITLPVFIIYILFTNGTIPVTYKNIKIFIGIEIVQCIFDFIVVYFIIAVLITYTQQQTKVDIQQRGNGILQIRVYQNGSLKYERVNLPKHRNRLAMLQSIDPFSSMHDNDGNSGKHESTQAYRNPHSSSEINPDQIKSHQMSMIQRVNHIQNIDSALICQFVEENNITINEIDFDHDLDETQSKLMDNTIASHSQLSSQLSNRSSINLES